MKIREYKKSLMVVKDIDSPIISEAYFILKSGVGEDHDNKISEEAERIIRECGETRKKKRRASLTAFLGISATILLTLAFIVFAIIHLMT